MSLVARCGPVVLLLSLLFGTAASAQSPPQSSGSWTDPPVRGAAGPPAASKPNDAKVSGPTAKAPSAVPAKPSDSAAAPAAKPATARAAAAPAAKPAFRPAARLQRAIAFRRYPVPIRRLAARPRAIAAVPTVRHPWRERLRIAARQEREVHRHAIKRTTVAARREAPETADRPRRRVAGMAIRRSNRDYAGRATPVDGSDEPPMQARRAGWGGLMGDDRAYRIAQARASGYRVMRMRTYEYPDGSIVQRMTPYGPEDFD